jgi:hypothetical protein
VGFGRSADGIARQECSGLYDDARPGPRERLGCGLPGGVGEEESIAASFGTIAGRVTAPHMVQIELAGTAIRTEHSAHRKRWWMFVMVCIALLP